MTVKHRLTYVAVLLALAMFAAACGGDDFSDAGESSEAGDTAGSESDESEETTEAGDDGVAIAAEAPEEEAMEQDAMEGEAAGADERTQSAPTTSSPDASTDEAADGGFFGPAPEDEESDAEANKFKDYGVRPFVPTDVDPLSTFALDVDTASYSIGQTLVESGSVPPLESVRVEEYLNSFDYDYLAPSEGLNVQADGGPSPYDSDNVIVRVGVQAEKVSNADRPNASLTFVVDTSGSMDRANRLELVRSSLRLLVEELESRDTVSIITYSDNAQILLSPTSVDRADEIIAAIDRLQPTGSTNLEAGLQAGYDMANEAFQLGGINRVILASDGVANVGLTDPDGLSRLIRDDADRGIQLVTVGVGMGGFNDVLMEQLADQGDGFYAYVDDQRAAAKLFSDDLVSTLLTVAIDGKIQVEFNEDAVDEYRLIGFENRAVLDDDFRNDAVDAGELGAGHQVTALYELKLKDNYRESDQLGTVQLRWEDPEERSVRESRLILTPGIIDDRWNDTDEDFRLAVTVAAFAELLRDSPHTGEVSLTQVGEEADALSSGSGAIQELAEMIWAVEARS